MIDPQKVGKQIAVLRKKKNLTQNDLGERLGISFQAVSKWERGETLPDTGILIDLANVLETTVDFLLTGGEAAAAFKGKISVSDMISGIRCISDMGQLLGRDNLIYRLAVDGINRGMNTDVEMIYENDRFFEAFVAEALIQNLRAGAFVDVTDVKYSFAYDHFRDIVLNECEKRGIH